MSILLVSYDLKKPGRNYEPVWNYLKKFNHCKALESLWLLDTAKSVTVVRDELKELVDTNDRTFVCRIYPREWATTNGVCGSWLNDNKRNW